MFRLIRLAALIVSVAFVWSANAEPLSKPTGPVLLTISGQISNMNGDGSVAFDRAMLEQLDWRDVRTFTSFSDGEQQFAGPTLSSVLKAVGARGEIIVATAINDYSVQIPISHAEAHDVLLALDWNGRAMRIRDKGPIWIVYPLDEATAQTQKFDPEMIWQLNRLAIQ